MSISTSIRTRAIDELNSLADINANSEVMHNYWNQRYAEIESALVRDDEEELRIALDLPEQRTGAHDDREAMLVGLLEPYHGLGYYIDPCDPMSVLFAYLRISRAEQRKFDTGER